MSGRDTEVMGLSTMLMVARMAILWHPTILFNILKLMCVVT